MPRGTQDTRPELPAYAYRALTVSGRPSQSRSTSLSVPSVLPYNPTWHARWFGLLPLSLATTRGIVSFPPGTEMFQFPGFPSPDYVFIQRCVGMPPRGFPHSDISGSTGAHPSPELFAVYHVLHRHLTPRHPPCALSSLSTCDAEKLMFSRYFTLSLVCNC